jgi:hypothetical protein
MNCQEFENHVDDFMDDALPEPLRHFMEAHVAECAACRDTLEATRALLQKAAQLQPSVSPERDLWAGIEQRIEPQAREESLAPVTRWRFQRVLALAAVVMLCIGAWHVFAGRREFALDPDGTQQNAQWETIRDAEADYLHARADLFEAFKAGEEDLSEETVQLVEEHLDIIDDALQEIRGALEQNPENLQLIQLLMATHEKGIKMLDRVLASHNDV